ncbi:MAG TPA: hypothetical protein VEY93_16350, partial [Longimicrobium sp.]|nr:hypothetical protein [Longimicrobium sp.]
MFGLEILHIIIGLTFIYLLLSLMATAINEYLAAMRNKRGNELAKGIARLLDDIDGSDALDRAMAAVKARAEIEAETITERFYSHRLIRPLATRRGWIVRLISGAEARMDVGRSGTARTRGTRYRQEGNPRPEAYRRPRLEAAREADRPADDGGSDFVGRAVLVRHAEQGHQHPGRGPLTCGAGQVAGGTGEARGRAAQQISGQWSLHGAHGEPS